MVDINERFARNVSKFVIGTLVDEIGKFVVASCDRRPGPVVTKLSTDNTEVKFSVHLNETETQEKEE